MHIYDYVQKFKANSSNFYDDLDLEDVDGKHAKIVASAYDQIKNLTLDNFRTWTGQDDLDCPKQFYFDRGFLRGILRPIFYKVFKSRQEELLLQSLRDDISMLDTINGFSLILDNPVHKTPGVKDFYSIFGTTVNFRWLRYIYLTKRILDTKILNSGGIWVDIGSYYGGLQGLVKKYNPEARIVMVDFQHQLCRSYIYLSNLYPNATHILPNQAVQLKSFDSLPKGSITYVPATKFSHFASFKAQLVSNFFSFGEMTHNAFDEYFSSDLVSKSESLFLVNRFVSAPFFESTYGTDLNILDYLKKERNIDYFDIFPMHHYMLHDRYLFNRSGFRNSSSSYFEYISSLDGLI